MTTKKLQWGHASSSVERVQGGCNQLRTSIASMGPRFFKRGEAAEDRLKDLE